MRMKLAQRIRSGVATVGEEIAEKAWTVGRDPKAERKKRLAWGVVQGTIGAVFTLGARRVGAKAWGVLTGERPPTKK